MSREVHVQFCERVGVRLPCATHLVIAVNVGEATEAAKKLNEAVERLGFHLHPGQAV